MHEIKMLNQMIRDTQERLKTCDESHRAALHEQLSRLVNDLAWAGYQLDGINPF